MKKFLLMMLVVWTGVVSSCKYDDDELWGSVDDLANRISAMETLTQQMNSDIAALQAIVTAVEKQIAVSEVEKLTDGYILHFTNGQTATIKNGIDGQDGKDAPTVGLEKEGGVYYWTLTVDGQTEWLTDEAGNKIAVTNDSEAVGSTGSAGRTPTLKVDEDGYWMVSYDGTNFDYIKDTNGQNVKASGTNGVAQFKEPEVSEDGESITIVMADDTEYVLPLLKSIEFYTDEACTKPADIKNIPWNGTSENVTYYCKLNIKGASHEVVDKAGINLIGVEDIESNEGETKTKVTLALSSNVVSDGRLVVLFFNENRTLTAVFKFIVAPWDGTSSVEVTSNGNVYDIATPANLKWIAEQVNSGTSFDGKTIKLLNDIDLAGHEWIPIGQDSKNPFSGTFDGNGKTIKGLTIGNTVIAKSLSRADGTESTGAEVKGAGLFGVVKGATLKAVTITDAVIKAENVTGAGVLVGCALDKVTIEGVTIEKETSKEPSEETPKADVEGSQNVGGIAGFISACDVTIKDCEVKSANLDASSSTTSSDDKVTVGGVVGTLKVVAGENGNATLNIEGNKVGGVELSTLAEGSTSTSAGGVIGALEVDEDVELTRNISGNTVSETKTDTPSDEDTPSTGGGTVTQTQGPVIGNMSELNSEISADIMKNNTVGEGVGIETQLTIQNLQAVLENALAVNSVNTFTVKGTIGQNKIVEIPTSGVDVTLNFDALVTTSDKVLTIVQGAGDVASASTHQLNINMPMTDGGQYLNIKAPETTVTLTSGNYAVVTSLTAKNTLMVKKGVVIERLEVVDGSVDVYGYVKDLVRVEGYTDDVTVTIMEGGEVDNIHEGFELLEGNPGVHELALKEAAKNGGSFTVTEKLRLTSPLIVRSDFTLNFSNGAFWGDEGQFVDSKGWKAMVVVMPGATFTYNGGGEFNTGHMLTQLSCIRMAGGSDAPSKVIMNNGNLIGTYHAILIDEDCQNAEVEINGGTLSCDWWNEFHGVNIFNKSDAKITIKGGSITSYTNTKISCIEMWGGELNISGGQFNTNLTNVQEGLDVNPNVGNTLIGPAIAIAPKRDVTVNISEGDFTGDGSSSFMEKIVDSSLLGKVNVNLSISGGTFNAAVSSQDCKNFISGGQFKVQPKDIYLASNKSVVKNGDYYELVDGEGGENENPDEGGTNTGVSNSSSSGNNFSNGGEF